MEERKGEDLYYLTWIPPGTWRCKCGQHSWTLTKSIAVKDFDVAPCCGYKGPWTTMAVLDAVKSILRQEKKIGSYNQNVLTDRVRERNQKIKESSKESARITELRKAKRLMHLKKRREAYAAMPEDEKKQFLADALARYYKKRADIAQRQMKLEDKDEDA